MRVTSLGSGSSGNALLVEAGPQRRTKLLVDAGLSARQLIERLRQAGTHPAQLSGILVTHEHSDHIIGLPVLTRLHAIPVITAPETLAAIERCFSSDTYHALQAETGEMLSWSPVSEPISVGSGRLVGDIEIKSFPVSHDAAAPCGYLLSSGGCRICIAIDSGEVTPAMLEAIFQADLLILESNHDRQRLVRGPYPYHLKQRILSPTGHLSNDQAADAVLHTWRADSIRWLWLSHLSRTNNTPKLALNSMLNRLQAARASLSQIHISVLPPGMGYSWDSTQLWREPSLWELQQD